MIRWPTGPDAGRGVLWLSAVLACAAGAGELPQFSTDQHMGVASCASSMCHGRVLEAPDGNVRLDEYRIWSRHDRHARAYRTLLGDESAEIAGKLGLSNAHEADVCLDCHADNVPASARGFKFLIEDGVGCEACHGGSERWLTAHTAPDARHQDNLDSGMYATADLRARAELCLSCHLGTAKKFATHRILGAGHPRLSFELDTFTLRAPEHYHIDDDYRRRKADEDPVARWAVGALVGARQYARLLQSPLFADHPVYPEIALFDCHSCHAPFKELDWMTRPATKSLGPGQVRLNDSSLLMAVVALSQYDRTQGERLYGLIRRLHTASAENREAVRRVSARISELLRENEITVARGKLSAEHLLAARRQLLKLGVNGELYDYAGAEQAVMSLDVLSFAVGDPGREIRSSLRRMYELVDDDDHYPPAGLAEEFRVFGGLAGVR